MTKKQQASEPVIAPDVQQDLPAVESSVSGRALIDLPCHGLKCGEYGALPSSTAASLEHGGAFDTRAVAP